jgi:hypothetical protein
MNLLRALVAFWFLLSFVIEYVFSVGEVGYAVHRSDGKAQVSAGSHPAFLVWAAVGLLLYFLLMRLNAEEAPDGVPTLRRRFLAFIIDFLFSLAIVTSFGGMLSLWVESVRTGHFSWHFARDYSVPTDDIFALPLVFLAMGLMFFYFVLPLMKGRQTIGCFILRLRVTPPFGDRGVFTFREALKRTWYEFKGLCSLLRVREPRDGQGRTWYDRETNCSVVLIRYQ